MEHEDHMTTMETALPSSSSESKGGSVIGASICMMLIALALCWLPFIGGFVAGFFGGLLARTFGRAIMAVFLPVGAAALFVFFCADSLVGLPLISTVLSLGVSAILVTLLGPMLLGALIGAVLR